MDGLSAWPHARLMGHSSESHGHKWFLPSQSFQYSQSSLARNVQGAWLVVRVSSPSILPSAHPPTHPFIYFWNFSFDGNMLEICKLLVALSLVTWELRETTIIVQD